MHYFHTIHTISEFSLVVCLAINLTACTTPEILGPNDTDGELTGTETTGTDSTTADNFETDGTGFESDTENTTDGTGLESDTENTTGDVWPLCVEPDPEVHSAYNFDLSVWDPEYDGISQNAVIDVEAECLVTTLAAADEGANITLSCTAGDKVGVAIGVSLSFPSGVVLPFAEGNTVQLRYLGHGYAHHTSPGSKFAIHDATGETVLLAGFADQSGFSAWSAILAPLTVARDRDVCPKACEGDCPGEFTREAFVVSAPMAEAAIVVDGNRGGLKVEANTYDVIVDTAVWEECLNCFGSFHGLIVRTD